MKGVPWLAAVAVLAACGQPGIAPKAAAADSLAADQVYDSMSYYLTRGGVRVSRVDADSAFLFQRTHLVNLIRLRVTNFDSTGHLLSVITAKRGTYDLNNESLDAHDSVVATATNGKVLRTEHLTYDNIQNEIRSDTAFTATTPDGALRGDAFTSTPDFKTVRVTHPRARGAGLAPAGKKKGGGR